MATGCSGTPQARKLGLKPGHRIWLDHPPPGWALEEPPDDLTHVSPTDSADVVIAFFSTAEELPRRLPGLVKRIFASGALWVAWPRRAGGHESDITDNIIRAYALDLGVVDVKVAAIDADWSGIRLVWRLTNRPSHRRADVAT